MTRRPLDRYTDAMALIRAMPAHVDGESLLEWRTLAAQIIAEWGEPLPIVEGLAGMARHIASLLAAAMDATVDAVLDPVYSGMVDAAAEFEQEDTGPADGTEDTGDEV